MTALNPNQAPENGQNAPFSEPKPAKRGLRASINAMCRNCTYDTADKGTWRQQVEACAITRCPLWPVRPVSTGGAV